MRSVAIFFGSETDRFLTRDTAIIYVYVRLRVSFVRLLEAYLAETLLLTGSRATYLNGPSGDSKVELAQIPDLDSRYFSGE